MSQIQCKNPIIYTCEMQTKVIERTVETPFGLPPR